MSKETFSCNLRYTVVAKRDMHGITLSARPRVGLSLHGCCYGCAFLHIHWDRALPKRRVSC